MNRKWLAAGLLALLGLGGGLTYFAQHEPLPVAQTVATSDELAGSFEEILAAHRKLIVLFADDAPLDESERERIDSVGQFIFHQNRAHIADFETRLVSLMARPDAGRFEHLGRWLDRVESDPDLYDADRLAFRDALLNLQALLAAEGSLPAIKLHRRIAEDLTALDEIERNYEKEIRLVFGRFETRGIAQKRERWEDYVSHLQKRYQRAAILAEYPSSSENASASEPGMRGAAKRTEAESSEVYGRNLPAKTLVLTFDDGPHAAYTKEIAAILKQYGIPGVFFQVGSNLGTLESNGKAKLSPRADISRRLLDAGHTLGNHSLTHAQLAKISGDALRSEIVATDTLLKAVDERRAPLFRFPYGAHNPEGMELLQSAHLRSIMWNIDSLDWADPLPASITERVLKTVEKEGRGIVLFHDIHQRTVKALPGILDRLIAEGYQFAAWDGKGFSVSRGTPPPANNLVSATGYADSWAVIVGIDDYARWPKLQYAVRDARAVRDTLVGKFGFAKEKVILLENGEATRSAILGAFNERLAQAGLKRNDRLFVFFAGHGATRQLASGRELGYLVPADADPAQLATDGIPMSELQNVAESLAAKHALFVMDACYSGLGLTRGAGSANFMRDNARRLGRQMLTAGGADQLVADGGPNGHSVFTWTLLQGLAGKGDLNGDGLITATELAAYIAPAVAAVSRQTPAFGSLPGSEGGDFVFELPSEGEFLGPESRQLAADAIALNGKLDAASPPSNAPGNKPASVTVKDLDGGEQKLTPPAAIPSGNRQQAQRANDRGLQHYREKQYADAEAQFHEALRLWPEFALAANNLGFVYYKQEKYAEAIRWFETTLKLDPSRAVAWLNLGDAHVKAAEVEKARKAYQTYLELLPAGPGAAYVKEALGRL